MLNSSGSARRTPQLAVECLEDRTVPTFLTKPGLTALQTAQNGGESLAIGNVIPEAGFGTAGVFQANEYVTGTGPGRESLVRISNLNGTLLGQFVPYAGFTGGVNVAVGDVTGDSNLEIIVSAASSLNASIPQVKVFSNAGVLLSQFNVFSPGYQGGISIAVGNVLGGVGSGGFGGGNNSSFKSEIIAGASLGNAPHVVVADATGNIFRSFFAFDNYLGGVTLAASSVDSTRTPGSSGGGGGFFGGFGGGTRVPDTNSYAEIIVGAATNVPHVKVFEAWQAGSGLAVGPAGVVERLSYYAFDPSLGRGITVAAGSTDGSRGAEVYAGLIGATPAGGTLIRAFNGETSGILAEFTAFPPAYSRVVNMAVGNVVAYDPGDDDVTGFGNNGNPFFNTQDLAVVAGDGPFEQVPRQFFGVFGSAAGRNGP